MQTELFTQLPFGVTRVQASSSAAAPDKDYVRTVATAEANARNFQQSISAEKAKDLEKSISSLNKELIPHNVELKFNRDDKTGIVVLKLVDSNTGDSLKQIPSEVSIRLAAAFSKLQIHLLNSEV